MNAVLLALVAAVVVLGLLLALAVNRVLLLAAEADEDGTAAHAKCIAHIADVTSKRVVAMALREYARKWESIEEQPNLTRLGREVYKAGGPSMPTIWLNQQADLLDPKDTP